MVASVVTIAVFIADVTSALTQRSQEVVRNVNDLHTIRGGGVTGSSTVDSLVAQRIAFNPYAGRRMACGP
jgi:hypothetical protein